MFKTRVQVTFTNAARNFQASARPTPPTAEETITQFRAVSISPKKQLLILRWMLATPDSFRSASTKFGVGKATACRALFRVTKAWCRHIARFIRWPTRGEAEWTRNKLDLSYGFPQGIGAIDGTHIEISPSKVVRMVS